MAEAGLPASSALTLSGPEAKIVQRIERARQSSLEWASLRLSIFNGDITAHDPAPHINRALQADEEFTRHASSKLSEQEGLVRRLQKKTSDLSAELLSFRLKHDLSRDGDYPSFAKKFLTFSLLTLLVIIEGVLNAVFFSQGIDTGLIGGFFYAATFAFLNLLVAFSIGAIFVRFIVHRRLWGKLLGLLGIIVATASMLTMGLLIAHFRDALSSQVPEPAAAALESLRATPIELHDIMSWLLFAISITFALVALFDGIFANDRYPGYGRLSSRADTSRSEYEDELEKLRADLQELKSKALRNLDRDVAAAQTAARSLERLLNDKRNLEETLHSVLKDSEGCLPALLGIFRTANEQSRNGLASPKYFRHQPPLIDLRMPEFNHNSDQARLEQSKNTMRHLAEQLQEIRGRIQASFDQQFDRLTPLGTQFANQGDD